MYNMKILENRWVGFINSSVGSETWEASLILSAWLYLNRNDYLKNKCNVMELGAGVGLPSIMLLKQFLNYKFDSRIRQFML